MVVLKTIYQGGDQNGMQDYVDFTKTKISPH